MPIVATTRVWSTRQVEGLLEGVVQANIEQWREGLLRTPLYQSGVRYQAEPLGSEVWQTAFETYTLGAGDCEDLASALVAEYRFLRGIHAKVHVKDVRPGLRHVVVLLPGGAIEDPSKVLGMGKGGV